MPHLHQTLAAWVERPMRLRPALSPGFYANWAQSSPPTRQPRCGAISSDCTGVASSTGASTSIGWSPVTAAAPVGCQKSVRGCDLHRRPGAESGMILARVAAAALPDLRSARRLAGAPGALQRGKGRRAARVASRGRGTAAQESTTSPGLGRPGGPGRVDSAAAETADQPTPGDTGHGPSLASPPGRA